MTTTFLRRAGVATAALLASTCLVAPAAQAARPAPASVTLTVLSTMNSGLGEGATEIVEFDSRYDRAFTVNAVNGTVDVTDLSDPRHPQHVASLATPGVNSVAVGAKYIAVAQQAEPKTAPGTVSLFDRRTLKLVDEITVGALPDMVTFTPDGHTILVANEGEPTSYCAGDRDDPEGSVSIIDVRRKHGPFEARTASFTEFNRQIDALRAAGVRISGPGSTVAEDLEPEYIAVDKTGRTAYVTLQENNAVAVIDVKSATVTKILPLGTKDHALAANALDASDEDGDIKIKPWPVKGLYMPDGIDTYRAKGKTYFVTANEGDSREDWGCAPKDPRVKKLKLDPTVFPNAKTLQKEENLGRLTVLPDSPQGANGYTELWSYGARSITVRDAAGHLVWDSGRAIEDLVAQYEPAMFNAEDEFDDRSDNKGPEPENVVVGTIKGRSYAFVALERTSAIAIFDITDPAHGRAVGYVMTEGDIAPEGLTFVPASDSPTHQPLLMVANEVSGTMTTYQVKIG